jgi:molybdopterin molybdotransferase
MKNIPDSLSPTEAWERLSKVSRLETKFHKVKHALNCVLAEDLTAPEDIPSGHRSFMDGYAVRSQDTTSAPVVLELISEIGMGEQPQSSVQPNTAIRIPTGGFLPEDADAVVMQENTEIINKKVRILKAVKQWENVQFRGEDFRKGETLLPQGHRLRPQDLSGIATFGISEIKIYPKPFLRIFSTGNELVQFEQNAVAAGMIRETNTLSLSSALSKFGFESEVLGIFKDEFEIQRRALTSALKDADVVLISGGSSVGDRDYTLEVIQSFDNHEIIFHGLAIRPGNPTIFARIGKKYVFGLPGQPVSSLIVFYQFVLPFLFHLSGDKVDYSTFQDSNFASIQVHLVEPVQPLKTKTDYVRLQITRDKDRNNAKPILGKSASLSTLVRADGYMIVPPGEKTVETGSALKAYLFP